MTADMPLKGSMLKDLYPENGMREMADNDMLYDADKQQEVMGIMLGHGYTAESVGGGKNGRFCACAYRHSVIGEKEKW